jgi:hypothetical protein
MYSGSPLPFKSETSAPLGASYSNFEPEFASRLIPRPPTRHAAHARDTDELWDSVPPGGSVLRKVGVRTREALVETLSAFMLEAVEGWFAHCGYLTWEQ